MCPNPARTNSSPAAGAVEASTAGFTDVIGVLNRQRDVALWMHESHRHRRRRSSHRHFVDAIGTPLCRAPASSKTEEEVLSKGWDHRTALPELVAELQISEPTIAHHLIDLGLAADVGEIVDRLGTTPGGSVEARARHLRAELADVEGSATSESRTWVLRRKLDGRDAGRSWTTPASSG